MPVSRMWASVVGNSVARSNTIDDETYTSRSTRSSSAARKTPLYSAVLASSSVCG